MNSHHYLGIDLGAESGRVMHGVLTNSQLTVNELHRFPNALVRLGDTLRWDVLRLWNEIKAGLKSASESNLPIHSVGVDSWALDYVLMRGSEPMLRAPFCYRDARSVFTYEPTRTALGDARIYQETGTQFMPVNTLYHLVAEAQDEAGLLDVADRFLMIGDWFHYLLCGRPAQEESNASTTQLWNPITRTWSADLIRALSLPREIFPEVVPPCTKLGSLTPALEQETGLKGVEVVAGCVHDTGAAVAAVPAGEGDDWAYLSSGTWSLIGVELPAPLISEEGRLANFTNETGVGGTSRFLRNASGLWILQECRRAWEREGFFLDYDDLAQQAAAAEPFRSLIDPDDARFLRPKGMREAVRDFCRETGQPLPETPGQYARCVFESLALLYWRMLELLERVTKKRINTVHVVGGGCKNQLLNQMTANATGRAVVAGPAEATAIGNILLQALALGHLSSHQELRQVVRHSFPVRTFTPREAGAWQTAHTRLESYRTVKKADR